MKLFEDLPSTNRPITAENLNQIQDNLVVVSATEPTGDNREKVWIQKTDTEQKIYIRNDNNEYEEFSNTRATKIANNETNKIKIIGHRGVSHEEPENTIPSFQRAGIQGLWGCETDIMATSDGHLVCFHDDTVDRMTDGTGSLASKTLAQVQALTIDSGTNISNYTNLKIPTFEEYLNVCYRWNLVPVIEIKSILDNSNLDTMLNCLKEYGFENNAVIISFNLDYLNYIRSKSDVTIQALLDLNEDNINYCVENKFDIDAPYTANSFDLIKLAHSKGVKVNFWNITSVWTWATARNYMLDYITLDSIKYYYDMKLSINNMNIYNEYELRLLQASDAIPSVNILKKILCRTFGSAPVPNYPKAYDIGINRATSYDMIKATSSNTINYNVPSGYSMALHQYDKNGVYLADGGWKTESGSFTPSNASCSFVVAYFKKNNNSFITDYDLEQMKTSIISVT